MIEFLSAAVLFALAAVGAIVLIAIVWFRPWGAYKAADPFDEWKRSLGCDD